MSSNPTVLAVAVAISNALYDRDGGYESPVDWLDVAAAAVWCVDSIRLGGFTRDHVAALEGLVRDLLEDDECDLDHHGYCQAHVGGFREVDGLPECWMIAARRTLKESL